MQLEKFFKSNLPQFSIIHGVHTRKAITAYLKQQNTLNLAYCGNKAQTYNVVKAKGSHLLNERTLFPLITLFQDLKRQNNIKHYAFLLQAAKLIIGSDKVTVTFGIETQKFDVIWECPLTEKINRYNDLPLETQNALNLFSDIFAGLVQNKAEIEISQLNDLVFFDSAECGLNENAIIGLINAFQLMKNVKFVFWGGFLEMVKSYILNYTNNSSLYTINSLSFNELKNEYQINFYYPDLPMNPFDDFFSCKNDSENNNVVIFRNKEPKTYIQYFGGSLGNEIISLTTNINHAKRFSVAQLENMKKTVELQIDSTHNEVGLILYEVRNSSNYESMLVDVPF